MIELSDVKERIKLFLKNKTYTFISLKSKGIFNGYILSVDESSIMFDDDFLNVIPIIIDEIDILDYSKKKQNIDSGGSYGK